MSIPLTPRSFRDVELESDTASEETTASPVASAPHDGFLVQAMSRGETPALEELISRYWGPLASYASWILGDMAMAEDVVQTVFVELWIDRGSQSPRATRAYLFRAVRLRALDEIRRNRARERRERTMAEENAPEPRRADAMLEEVTLTDTIDAAIQRLPERRREAFVLAYLKQLSYAEVAAVMEISVKTVGHHISAALKELRQTLGPILRPDSTGADVETPIRSLHPIRATSPPSPDSS